MKYISRSLLAILVAMPFVASAATITDANSLLGFLTRTGNTIITVLISFAVLYLVFTAIQYIMAEEGDDKNAKRSKFLWGLVGLVAIMSIWGIVWAIKRSVNFGSNTAPTSDFPRIIPPPNI